MIHRVRWKRSTGPHMDRRCFARLGRRSHLVTRSGGSTKGILWTIIGEKSSTEYLLQTASGRSFCGVSYSDACGAIERMAAT